jgi:uncharacterized membrane protein YczE
VLDGRLRQRGEGARVPASPAGRAILSTAETVTRRRFVPPRIRGGLGLRCGVFVFGLFLCALGIVGIYDSRLGLSPWDVLNQGVARHTPLSFGTANVAIALVVLIAAWRVDGRVRAGTIGNAILIGTFVDLLLRVGAVQQPAHSALPVRVLLLVGGIATVGAGTALYISAEIGAGPRDSLMLGITQRMHARVGVVRAWIEISATVAGFAMGGTVGIGTLAFALGIGPAVELSFAALGHPRLSVRDELALVEPTTG